MSNIIARQRKIKKVRQKIKQLNVARLSVHRTPRHIYAQVVAMDGKILASASSLDAEIKTNNSNNLKAQAISSSTSKNDNIASGKLKIAQLVGKLVAERCRGKVEKIAFDRSGFKYHGRIKALADAARENGLSF